MPYKTNAQLIRSIPAAKNLPEKAKSVFRHAYNTTVMALQRGGISGEERAAKAGWGAVKKSFKRTAKGWVRRKQDRVSRKKVVKKGAKRKAKGHNPGSVVRRGAQRGGAKRIRTSKATSRPRMKSPI